MNRHSTGQQVVSTIANGDYRERIDAVTAHIQCHIDGELQLEKVAGIAGFSPFHFHRIFAGVMGETIAEYVRRVRLGSGVQRLLHSNEPVSEIALAVGYETPAAFTKAFRQRFGIVPTALRTMERTQAYALLLDQPPAIRLKSRKINPEIRTLPDQRVLYARSQGLVNHNFNRASQEAFRVLMSYLGEHNLWGKFTMCLGIQPDDPNVIPHDKCRYDAGVVLKEGVHVKPSGKVGMHVLPSGRWAVFKHQGPYETLWQSWNAVYRDWLPRSGETPRDLPPLEIYLDAGKKIKPEELRTEILIPIHS
jgi:AraC family transcriptional regulator